MPRLQVLGRGRRLWRRHRGIQNRWRHLIADIGSCRQLLGCAFNDVGTALA